MARIVTRSLVWLGAIALTVSVGVGALTFLRHRHTVQVTSAATTESRPEQPITFTGGVSTSAFMTHYSSSDGKYLRFGCFERGSTSAANRELREYRRAFRVVEQGSHLNDDGERVGERIVVTDAPGAETQAQIVWTERSRV